MLSPDCNLCRGSGRVQITHYEGCTTYYQCPTCCFYPSLRRPWAWEHADSGVAD